MEPDDLARFEPIDGVEVPSGAYLLADVDTGEATLNVTPDDALVAIAAEGRSPLTLDEGIALVTQFPELLREHNCFSLLGSRCGDRRVTAIWVSEGRAAPRLVLGRQPAHVARLGLVRPPERRGRPRTR